MPAGDRSGERDRAAREREHVLVPGEDGQTARQRGKQRVAACAVGQEDVVDAELRARAPPRAPTLRTAKRRVPRGASASMTSPAPAPTSARPTGAATDTRPLLASPSIAPTSSYSTTSSVARSRRRTQLPMPAVPSP